MTAEKPDTLLDTWRSAWPRALATWSRYTQLSEPRWCHTKADEKREGLTGSFAMIRLVDHAVVISLRQVAEGGLDRFATEILAHEIGHHVLCPADLADNARLLARTRAGLPTREHLAPTVANLYTDLLINDRLQRTANLDLAGVYLQLNKSSLPTPTPTAPAAANLWSVYLRTYEVLWSLPRSTLVPADRLDPRANADAALAARLIRSYASDFLAGAGRFACLCLTYLLGDEHKDPSLSLPWLDARAAGIGGLPDGLASLDPAELTGIIHPSEDPELSGVSADEPAEPTATPDPYAAGRNLVGGIKSLKPARSPFEYTELLRAAGTALPEEDLVARYYRELALPHLIPFPVRTFPASVDPLPEGLDTWDPAAPLEELDLFQSALVSPTLIPGHTTRTRLYGTSPGPDPQTAPVDLYLGVDCSGSMGNPARTLSYPVLAGAVIALSALRAGSRVLVALSGEPGSTVTTDGFIRDERLVLLTLTRYLGTGTTFGIHRLADTFPATPPSSNTRPSTKPPCHILIITDNDIFGMLDAATIKSSAGYRAPKKPPPLPTDANGWSIAQAALHTARGGGTMVLQLPASLLQHPQAAKHLDAPRARLAETGWSVANVDSLEGLVAFARQFVSAHYVSAHYDRTRTGGIQ